MPNSEEAFSWFRVAPAGPGLSRLVVTRAEESRASWAVLVVMVVCASKHDWSSLNNNTLHTLDGAKLPDLLG